MGIMGNVVAEASQNTDWPAGIVMIITIIILIYLSLYELWTLYNTLQPSSPTINLVSYIPIDALVTTYSLKKDNQKSSRLTLLMIIMASINIDLMSQWAR